MRNLNDSLGCCNITIWTFYTTSSRVSTEMGDRPFANLLLLLLLTGGYLIGQCTDLQKMHSMRRKSVMQEFYTQIIVMYMAE